MTQSVMDSGLLVRQMQDLLTGIYDLPLQYNLHDFLFTERERLPPPWCDSPTDEQVVILEGEGEAAVGLFLDAAVLARLAAANPLEALNAGNLADYWSALEGISHLLYLAWNAGHDRGVSLLELELQAEVDKYICSWWLLRAQNPTRHPAELHPLLFQRTRIDVLLAGERMDLYREAHRHAARFCRWIESRLSAPAAPMRAEVLAELRRFYRLSCDHKMRYIARRGPP
jgi:hypothetical protein